MAKSKKDFTLLLIALFCSSLAHAQKQVPAERKDSIDNGSNIIKTKLSQVCSIRPEGAEALSPGQRPGLLRMIAYRPVRAKALKLLTIYKAFALTGRLADCHYTQGVALG